MGGDEPIERVGGAFLLDESDVGELDHVGVTVADRPLGDLVTGRKRDAYGVRRASAASSSGGAPTAA